MRVFTNEELRAALHAAPEVLDGVQGNVTIQDVSDQPEGESSTGDAKEEALDTNAEEKDGDQGNVADLSLQPDVTEPFSETKIVVSPGSPLEPNNQGYEPGIRQPAFSLDRAKPLDSKLFPDQPRAGLSQLPGTIRNVEHLLKEYRIVVRYNVIKKKVMITLPGHVGTTDNLDNVAMTCIISLATLNGLPSSQIPAYIEVLADRNMCNPVADWILSKPWDGKERLRDICETIIEQDDFPPTLKNVLICKWLLSAVAAVLMPTGFKARGVLTLQGAQGLGKTSWVMSLVPDSQLRDMVVKVDHHMDGGNKDSIIGAVTHWLVEIGELDSSFKKDIARLKGFLTSDSDKIRQPYARRASEYQRRTVFMATVNQSDFLVDNTGNSRWWTIPVTKINYKHGIDMQQVFAQLAVDFDKGREWWLAPDEEADLNTCNKDHQSVSVIRELLMEKVDLDLIGKDGNPAMTASRVLSELGYKNFANSKARECGTILRDLFGDPKKIQGEYKWRIPLKRPTGSSASINEEVPY